MFWRQSLRDWIWWRNHVVAPFSEEFTFRACMVPVLLGQTKTTWRLELWEILTIGYLQATILTSGPSSSVRSSLEWLTSITWWRGSERARTFSPPFWYRCSSSPTQQFLGCIQLSSSSERDTSLPLLLSMHIATSWGFRTSWRWPTLSPGRGYCW